MIAGVRSEDGFWRTSVLPLTLRFGILIVIIVAWQIVGDDSRQIRMPTFTRTASSFWSMVASGELPRALVQSNIGLLFGYLLALSISIPLGILMGLSGTMRKLVNPYLTIMLSTPLIALLPILQAAFGLGLTTRVVVIFIFSFIYIAVNAMVGVRSVPEDIVEMARSFGASKAQLLRKIILRHAFPAIMAGARLGLARAVVGMVIAELFLVSTGLGSLLSFYMQRFDAGAVLAIALTMVAQGVILIALARKAEAALLRRW